MMNQSIALSELKHHFKNVDTSSGDGIVKCWHQLPKFCIYYYFRLHELTDLACDLLLISKNIENDAFARVVLSTLRVTDLAERLSIHELSANEYGFSAALLAPEAYHSELSGILKSRKSLVLCLPFHKSEFSGAETPSELAALRKNCVRTLDWARTTSPKITLRFENKKTRGGTIGGGYIFCKFDLVEREVANLDGVEEGFIEIVNFQGLVVEVLSPAPGAFSLIRDRDDSSAATMTHDEVIETLWSFLTS